MLQEDHISSLSLRREVRMRTGIWKGISEMFPFTMKFEKEKISDNEIISKAIGYLETDRVNEIQAVDSLRKALSVWN